MQHIYKIPILSSIFLGLKIVAKSIITLIKKPLFFIFFLYAGFMSGVTMLVILLVHGLLCLASQSPYFPLSKSIICLQETILKFYSEAQNNIAAIKFPQIYKTLEKLDFTNIKTEHLTMLLTFGILITLIITSLIITHYFYNVAMIAMARYFKKIKSNSTYAFTYSALSLDKKTKSRIWYWTIFSTLLSITFYTGSAYLFSRLPLYYMLQAYKIRYTFFIKALLTFITFYAIPLLAYEDLSFKELIKKLFTTIKKSPSSTLTIAIVLNFLPFYMSQENELIIVLLSLISFFILPVSQIILYHHINKSELQ